MALALLVVGSICFKRTHLYILTWCIALLNAVSEVASLIAVTYKSGFALSIIYNLYFALHAGLWLYLLIMAFINQRLALFFAVGTLVLSGAIHLFYRSSSMDTPMVILSSFINILFFGLLVVRRLRKEKIDFFSQPRFILLSAPVLFMVSNILNFGFQKSAEVIMDEEFLNLGLYEWINWSSNVVYYSLILLFFLIAGRFSFFSKPT